jgi:hypothetical protein
MPCSVEPAVTEIFVLDELSFFCGVSQVREDASIIGLYSPVPKVSRIMPPQAGDVLFCFFCFLSNPEPREHLWRSSLEVPDTLCCLSSYQLWPF